MDLNIEELIVKFNNREVGILKLLKDERIAFQYSEDWIKEGFSISPFSLPLEDKVFISNNPYHKGLYGVFGDSLPDGFGEFLVRRRLSREKIDFNRVSVLSRLSILNLTGLGGLEYFPKQSKERLEKSVDLDLLSEESYYHLENNDELKSLDLLYELGGASGGARPKVHIESLGFEWIVKFGALNDPSNIGVMEYNANLSALKSGIDINEFKLFDSKKTAGFFGAKRFDRENGRRVHVISLAAVLETTHQISNLDYYHFFQVVNEISVDKEDMYEVFRRMAFNVFYESRDDHSKNHAFIYDETQGGYRLSKAFDVTKTLTKPEHEMTINGKGKPEINDLISLGRKFNLKEMRMNEIINKIKEVITSIEK